MSHVAGQGVNLSHMQTRIKVSSSCRSDPKDPPHHQLRNVRQSLFAQLQQNPKSGKGVRSYSRKVYASPGRGNELSVR